MGDGLKRAFAAAKTTQVRDDDVVPLRAFLHAINFDWEGVASPDELRRSIRDRTPIADRTQDRVRRLAKRNGWVTYQGGYWRISDAGRAALRNL